MSEPSPSYDELLSLVRQLQAENQKLRERIEQLERQGKRQAAPFRKGPPKAKPKKPGRKSGEQHGRHAHRPPPEQIHETHEADLPETCPHCQGELAETEVREQFQTELPAEPLRRKFNVHVGECRRCGRRVQGRHELQTSDALGAASSQVGPRAQAAVVVLNKECGLSHGKVADTLKQVLDIDLSRGASAQIVLRAGQRLEPTYEEIRQATKGAERLTVDETGWRIGGQSAWLHAWVSERATCYQIDPKRSAEVLESLIGVDWGGVMVHDGFASYDRFEMAFHQQCTAHLLRRAREMLDGTVGGAVRFPRAVRDLFTEAIHLKNEHLRGRVAEEAWEGARDRYEVRLLKLLTVPRLSGANQRLSNHLWNHFESWFCFLTDASVPATNWEAEQALRPAVVNRKVWGGNRTEAGARAQGILSSVLRTCHQQGRCATDYISHSLRAFGNPALLRPVLLQPR